MTPELVARVEYAGLAESVPDNLHAVHKRLVVLAHSSVPPRVKDRGDDRILEKGEADIRDARLGDAPRRADDVAQQHNGNDLMLVRLVVRKQNCEQERSASREGRESIRRTLDKVAADALLLVRILEGPPVVGLVVGESPGLADDTLARRRGLKFLSDDGMSAVCNADE